MGTRLRSTSCSHATKSCDVTIHNKNIGVLNVPMFMKHKTKNILNELLNNVETAVCSPRYEIKIWIDVLRAAMPAKLKKTPAIFGTKNNIFDLQICSYHCYNTFWKITQFGNFYSKFVNFGNQVSALDRRYLRTKKIVQGLMEITDNVIYNIRLF